MGGGRPGRPYLDLSLAAPNTVVGVDEADIHLSAASDDVFVAAGRIDEVGSDATGERVLPGSADQGVPFATAPQRVPSGRRPSADRCHPRRVARRPRRGRRRGRSRLAHSTSGPLVLCMSFALSLPVRVHTGWAPTGIDGTATASIVSIANATANLSLFMAFLPSPSGPANVSSETLTPEPPRGFARSPYDPCARERSLRDDRYAPTKSSAANSRLTGPRRPSSSARSPSAASSRSPCQRSSGAIAFTGTISCIVAM